jgi:hypothetical protein
LSVAQSMVAMSRSAGGPATSTEDATLNGP